MQSEIERVLDMVKDGTLTPEQAAEMIVALKDAIGTDPGRESARPDEEAPRDERGRANAALGVEVGTASEGFVVGARIEQRRVLTGGLADRDRLRL